MVKILIKSWKTPRIGDYFGFIQVQTFMLKHMRPCGNQSILGNNILEIQSTLTVCKTGMEKILTKSRRKPYNWWPFWIYEY